MKKIILSKLDIYTPLQKNNQISNEDYGIENYLHYPILLDDNGIPLKYENLYLILGILADKDVEEMIKIITPMAKKVYSVTPNSIRGELAESLKDEVSKYTSAPFNVRVESDVATFYRIPRV